MGRPVPVSAPTVPSLCLRRRSGQTGTETEASLSLSLSLDRTVRLLRTRAVESLLNPHFFFCRDPGSNRGPSDLQSDALPNELSRLGVCSKKNGRKVRARVCMCIHICN